MLKWLGACATALLFAGVAGAQSQDDLLPVEQAFQVKASLAEPGRIALRIDIAPDYYLYRGRIKAKTAQDGLELGTLDLPPGIPEHDEFQGDVEIYRGSVAASLPYTLAQATSSASVTLTVQGCHEVDPKICYPPHPTTFTLDLPASATPAAAAAGAAPPASGLVNLGGAGGLVQGSAPLPPEQAFVFEAIAYSPTQILARFTMPPGYYLYRDNAAFDVAPDEVRIGAPQWPDATPHVDDHFGEVQVFFDQIEVPIDVVPTQVGTATVLALTTDFQGCQLDGICYPPMRRSVDVELPPASAQQAALAAQDVAARPNIPAAMPLLAEDDAAPSSTGSNTGATDAQAAGTGESETDRLTGALAGGGWLTLGGFFIAGLLLAFTPCVLPMVPILSGLIAGAGTITTRRAFVLSLVYVLSSAVVFTLAGVIAGLAGQNLQALFQKPWILISFAVLFVALAFSMFGFYELQLPARWQTRLAQVSNRQSGGSLMGVAVMGVLSALIVGPCVAPPLAAAVAYIGRSGDPVLGGSALFALALGMGVPLLIVGTGAGRWLPRAGGWMDTVKAVFGVAFLFLAWWMLERILPPVWTLGLLGALLIGCGVYLGALQRLPDNSGGWRKLWQALGVMLLVLGSAQVVGALSGANDYLRPLASMGRTPTTSADTGNAFRPIAT
ncbi:MAG: protein-disulfide reductase DsbD, partial [Dokdonella sp.]|nr:protein-disulfide reductase DsbD [Dokdonella sp.]